MFFGLTNSPATFQTMMDDIFHEEIAQGWLRVYIDDVIIVTEDDDKLHEEKERHFLFKLALNNLLLKPEKCWFHQKEVEYLGVIIGQGSVKIDPIKVKGIMEWPTPTCIEDIRSFLGFCNFYRAFIPNFSLLAHPLNDLTKKNYPWRWSEQREKAFQWLKEACASDLVLRTPDWSRQFIMETDASGFALGALLCKNTKMGFTPLLSTPEVSSQQKRTTMLMTKNSQG